MTSRTPLAVLLFIYFTFALTTFFVWNQNDGMNVGGDEPHYLVMADGIGRYGSLEQSLPYKDEYLSKKIYKHGLGKPGTETSAENFHVVQGPNGVYNVHNIGLPILLTIPYLLAETEGAKLMMIAAGALVVLGAWGFAGLFAGTQTQRFRAVLAVTLSMPLIPAANQIYPDILAGVLALAGLYWFMTTNRQRRPLAELAWAAAIVFLPWLQIKFAATCMLLILAIAGKIYLESRDRQRVARILLVALLSCVALLAYNAYAFGKISGPDSQGALELSRDSVMVFFGLLYDQNQGFLLHNLINLAGLVALGALYRRDPVFTLLLGLVFLSLIVPNAMHPNWYGGGSFSGRFGLSAAIVFMVPVLFGLLRLAAARKFVFLFLAGVAVLLQLLCFYRYAFEHIDLTNRVAATWSNAYSIFYFRIRDWMPMMYNADWAYGYLPNYAWFFLVAALVLAGFAAAEKLEKTVLAALGLGCILIFAAGFADTGKPKNAKIFYGKDLPAQTGKVEQQMRIAKAGSDPSGFVNFGPYFMLSRGDYTATLTYSSPATPEEEIAVFDAFDATATRPLASLPLAGTNGGSKVVEASFHVNGSRAHSFEFRTNWNGRHDIRVHEILLREK